ncbi:uncharacterized protein EV154DRAFT_481202 [Mucor mucedo]|uniref:uncharacterized protein n=1 Tax=Mucor mucedo TaxID=29922 RepID=UPI00221F789F|nr:uncharacterized protein EV154DRAFT_481202 [Mucor mucedo]KAI7891558.1 hypothetical protein EV154DRAFT_481202 [Mucor mucedo]
MHHLEAYYHDKSIDTVAQAIKHDPYSGSVSVLIQNFKEGSEIIATGVFASTSNEQVQSFLWVRLPCNVCSDVTKLILLSLECIVLSKPYIRMLQNYCKRGSMKAWCYKSAYFSSIGFCKPNQLELYQDEPVVFDLACSKLIIVTIIRTPEDRITLGSLRVLEEP